MESIIDAIKEFGWCLEDLEIYSARKETFSAIRIQNNDCTMIIRHIPTGTVIIENSKNSQHHNILLALASLEEEIEQANLNKLVMCPACGYGGELEVE